MKFGLSKGGSCAANQSAFTLLEIMLVMLILSVLAGAVLTSMGRSYQHIALTNDAKTLEAMIHRAQSVAKTRRQVCRLMINLEEQQYSLGSKLEEEYSFGPIEGESGATVHLSAGIFFSDVRRLSPDDKNDTEILFFPDGKSEPTQIVLANGSGEERAIRINALSSSPQTR